jgi:DnaA family protein
MNKQQQLLEDLFTQDQDFKRFVAVGNELALRCIINNVNHIMHIVGAELSGKTHLLKSWINQARQIKRKTIYFDFRSDIYEHSLIDYDVIALDNIDIMQETAQIALFDLYNQIKLYNKDKFILTSSTLPLQQLNLRHDLLTRIMSGFVISLKSVEDQDLFVALKQYVEIEHLNISDAEIKYLVTHCKRNLGAIIKLINELSLYATIEKKPITIHLIREYLKS